MAAHAYTALSTTSIREQARKKEVVCMRFGASSAGRLHAIFRACRELVGNMTK
jgi:hypothetical protein